MDITITRQNDGQFSFTRDTGMAKSQAAREGLVAVRCVRLVQKGKGEMSAAERYLAGNAFIGMAQEESVLYCEPQVREALRKALADSGNAAALLDAGRLDEGSIVKALAATEGDRRDVEGNLIVGEPLRKGEEPTLFGKNPLLSKGGGAALVKAAYGEWMNADGSVDLKKATRELDELIRNMEGR